ncbi:MAG TPA: hypothetical protein VHD15_00350, partial [Hyphomicrobiales bacterium]|nr:hypothetical protein [Hyphomicrobiales bacterium]
LLVVSVAGRLMRFVRGRRSHRLGLVTALIVSALSLVLAASAAAEVRSGSATDGTEPERIPGSIDITAVSASYDTGGSVNLTVTTVAPAPETEEFVLTARLGVLSGGECVEPLAALLGTYERPAVAVWAFNEGEGTASESFSGDTTTLAASSSALANQPFNCVEPAIYEIVEGAGGKAELGEVVEGLTAPIQLVGPPPAPAPTPAPTPPPAPAPTPAPKANLTFPSKTVTVHRNAWKKVTVKVTNTGDAAAGKVALKVGKAKGVAIKPKSGKLKLKSIAAGKSKVASFKVRLTKKAKARSKLALAVSGAKGVKASGILTLEAWKKPKKGKKEKRPPVPATPPLAEKIFYAYKTETSHSATLIGYAFIDGEWAYHGIPDEGLPTCTEITGNAEKEGCVKYSYDPKSGSVQVGSLTGKISPEGGLEIDGETYFATSTPAAGTRLQVEQEFIGFSGLCGLIFGCTTWHEYLTLTSGGEFILSKESLTTAGGSGPGETFVAAGSYPPDQHGTYAIEKGARIKLSFADGSTQSKTFAIFLNKEGKPDPTYAGVLLGTTYFTFAHTE